MGLLAFHSAGMAWFMAPDMNLMVRFLSHKYLARLRGVFSLLVPVLVKFATGSE